MAIRHQVPRRLDDPPKILFWDADVFAALLVGVVIGIALGYVVYGTIVGLVAAAVVARLRRGRTRGYVVHLAYWYLPVRWTRRTPTSGRRLFIG